MSGRKKTPDEALAQWDKILDQDPNACMIPLAQRELIEALRDAIRQREEARAVLEWYAKIEQYNWGPQLSLRYKDPLPIEEDAGKRARAALGKPQV